MCGVIYATPNINHPSAAQRGGPQLHGYRSINSFGFYAQIGRYVGLSGYPRGVLRSDHFTISTWHDLQSVHPDWAGNRSGHGGR